MMKIRNEFVNRWSGVSIDKQLKIIWKSISTQKYHIIPCIIFSAYYEVHNEILVWPNLHALTNCSQQCEQGWFRSSKLMNQDSSKMLDDGPPSVQWVASQEFIVRGFTARYSWVEKSSTSPFQQLSAAFSFDRGRLIRRLIVNRQIRIVSRVEILDSSFLRILCRGLPHDSRAFTGRPNHRLRSLIALIKPLDRIRMYLSFKFGI